MIISPKKKNLHFGLVPEWIEVFAIDCVNSCTSLATGLAFLGKSWTRLASVLNGLIWSSDLDLFCDCCRGGDVGDFGPTGALRWPPRSLLGPRQVVLTGGGGLGPSSPSTDSTNKKKMCLLKLNKNNYDEEAEESLPVSFDRSVFAVVFERTRVHRPISSHTSPALVLKENN